MKINMVDPSSSLEQSISIIESNSGIEDYVPDIPAPTDRISVQRDALADGIILIEEISAAEDKRAKSLANYDVMTNTRIGDVVDLTGLDISPTLNYNSIDFNSHGLPNPEDYGKTIDEIMPFSAVNGSDWNLPKPSLSKLKPECYDLSDMYLSSLVDLSFLDMRGWNLPSIDFSWATDWDFPAWMDPSNVSPFHLFDFSSIDLSGIIDLSDISLPSWLIPGNWDIDWDMDLSGKWDALKGIFDGMGSAGDLLSMGSLASFFNGIGCMGRNIIDVCTPDAIIAALRNFSIPSMDGITDGTLSHLRDLMDVGNNLPEITDLLTMNGNIDYRAIVDTVRELDFDLPNIVEDNISSVIGDVKGPILVSLEYLGDEWYYFDKSMNKYNYDALVAVHDSILWCLHDEPNFTDIYNASLGAKAHYDNAVS